MHASLQRPRGTLLAWGARGPACSGTGRTAQMLLPTAAQVKCPSEVTEEPSWRHRAWPAPRRGRGRSGTRAGDSSRAMSARHSITMAIALPPARGRQHRDGFVLHLLQTRPHPKGTAKARPAPRGRKGHWGERRGEPYSFLPCLPRMSPARSGCPQQAPAPRTHGGVLPSSTVPIQALSPS